ncbi:alpha/beta hydrolase [Allorhodopirellula solitaria]|nr:alpha/beta hydrolase [Allorhodopirellula solitaria]
MAQALPTRNTPAATCRHALRSNEITATNTFSLVARKILAAFWVTLTVTLVTPPLHAEPSAYAEPSTYAEPSANGGLSATPRQWLEESDPPLPTPTPSADPASSIPDPDLSVHLGPDVRLLTATDHSATPAELGALSEPASEMPTLPSSLTKDLRSDRIWLINTRCLSHHTCCMDLNRPDFRVERLDPCGRRRASSVEEYLSSMDSTRPRIIYVHGNRRDSCRAISQGLYVYRQLACHRHGDQPFDWVIWSWPSDASALFIADAREKAQRTDSQGLYVAWLLREHYQRSQPTGLIGFSFGGRIVTGALHALAGGTVGRRTTGAPAITGANIDVGLLAPAVDTTWMMPQGRHGLATQNMNRLSLLYNRRDIALRFFKLVSRNPGGQALGYTGPRCFARRHDGTPLPVRAFDCAQTVGNHHSEKLYYEQAHCAGHEMGSLIESTMVID